MSSDSNSHKTEIIVALISVIGVLGAGVLANWDKIFLSSAKQQAQAVATQNTIPAANITPASNQQAAPAIPRSSDAPNTEPHFSGIYVGISTEGIQQSRFQVTFQRHGNSVTGTYIQNGTQGTIQGTVSGDTMHYQWSLATYSSRGVCWIQGNKTTGTWGYGTSNNNGGTMVAYLQ